jgi:hypothetical protein
MGVALAPGEAALFGTAGAAAFGNFTGGVFVLAPGFAAGGAGGCCIVADEGGAGSTRGEFAGADAVRSDDTLVVSVVGVLAAAA